MNTTTHTTLGSMAIGTALLLAACGGGSGGGSSPVPSTTTTTSTSALTALVRWGDARNDVHEFGPNLSLSLDGRAVSMAELHDGDVVIVHGTRTTTQSAFNFGTADTVQSIASNSAVSGPVDSLDLDRRRLVVMGQPVHFVNLDASDCPLCDTDGIPRPRVGDFVRVSGFRSATGPILAQRIDTRPAGEVQVVGTPTTIDTAGQQFHINDLLVDYSGASPAEIPATPLADGAHVYVVGTLQASPRALLATRVTEVRPLSDSGAGDVVIVEGFVDAVHDATTAVVSGIVISGPNCEELHVNSLMRFVGRLTGSGSVSAGPACDVLDSGSDEVRAPIDAIDAANESLTALGVTVQGNFATRLGGGSAIPTAIAWSHLSVGDFVVARGWQTDVAPVNGLIAQSVDSFDTGEKMLIGRPSRRHQPDIFMFGQRIHTDDTTLFFEESCSGTSGPSRLDAAYYFQHPQEFFQRVRVERVGDDTLVATSVTLIPICWWE